MNAVIKLHKHIYEAIINHAHMDSKLECGGYLYGYSKRTENGMEVIVTDIYYEKIFGTDCSFKFNLLYEARAKAYQYSEQLRGRKIHLVGCYHSHGDYPAIFSPEDRLLQRFWAGNQITIIYSPGYNEIIGDLIRCTGEVTQARITTFDSDIYDQSYFENVAYDRIIKSDKSLSYVDGDRSKTLKMKPKKR